MHPNKNHRRYRKKRWSKKKDDRGDPSVKTWATVLKSKPKPVEPKVDCDVAKVPVDCGDTLSLNNNYIIWSHDISNKEWDLESYSKLCNIDNVSTFWRVFNNLNKLGYRYKHFYFMKDDTEPLWEHENNRDGGVCSFRVDINSSLDVFEYLSVAMLTNNLNDNSDDINGISISPKNSWAIIKIWNKDSKNDLTKTLKKDILNKYSNISVKYRANDPEY